MTLLLLTWQWRKQETIPLLDKLDPQNQNSQFRLKFGTKLNSNMQSSMALFIFSF